MKTSIITERLLIDLLATSDEDFIFEIVNTKGWLKFIGDRNIHSKEDAAVYIKKILSNSNIIYYIVRLKENKIPAGIISFIKRDYLQHWDIGFAFLPKFEGRGYAFEAAKEVLLAAIKNPEHSNIFATTLPGNVSSIKLLKKLGLIFKEEIQVENELLHLYSGNKSQFTKLSNDDFPFTQSSTNN
jgi:RimJ/RimL family protein N-acetyltransferase